MQFGAILRAFEIGDLDDDNIGPNHCITAGGGTSSTVLDSDEQKDAVRLEYSRW